MKNFDVGPIWILIATISCRSVQFAEIDGKSFSKFGAASEWQFDSFVNCKMIGDEFMKINFNHLLRGDTRTRFGWKWKPYCACLIIIRSDYTIRANNHRCVYVRVYVRQVFDGNPMPCRKKRANDYGAAPEAAQWNGSMDEPPVASLTDQLPAQGTFDNLCCIRCIRARAFCPGSRILQRIRSCAFSQRRKFHQTKLLFLGSSLLSWQLPSLRRLACIISECSMRSMSEFSY